MRVPSSLLRQQVTVERYLGESGTGGPVFGPPVTVRARVEPSGKVYRLPDGTEQVAAAVAWVRPDVEVAAEDRVTCAGQPYEVAKVADQVGLSRTSHRELVLAELDAGT